MKKCHFSFKEFLRGVYDGYFEYCNKCKFQRIVGFDEPSAICNRPCKTRCPKRVRAKRLEKVYKHCKAWRELFEYKKRIGEATMTTKENKDND